MAQTVRVRSTIRLVVCCASLCLVVGVALAQTAGSSMIVVFKEGTPLEVQKAVVALSLSTIVRVLSLSDSIAVQLPLLNPQQALAILQLDPYVEEVIEDLRTVIDGSVCIDPAFPPVPENRGWGLLKSNFEKVPMDPTNWTQGVEVAVLDTGIDWLHADLLGKVLKRYNVTDELGSDQNGHGTHIAGIIAAIVNQLGLVGGVPTSMVTLASVKMLNYKGIGSLSEFCEALEWVYDNGSQVVNMSVGFPDNTPLRRTTERLYNNGAIMVAAAGNRCAKAPKQEDGGDDECDKGASAVCDDPLTDVKCPACYPWVLAVGATNEYDDISAYSCEGAEMDLVAPGGERGIGRQILSTNKGGGYGLASGTSQAAAHVTAAVALALLKQPELSLEQLRSVLLSTAKRLPGVDKWLQGGGRLDAKAMMDALPWKQK